VSVAAPLTDLNAQQLAQFQRDGFVAVPRVFLPEEIAEIRDRFMDVASHGPVEGLSETRQPVNRGGTAEYAPSDPLGAWPRMLHPHKHPELPVGAISMKYMLHPRLEPILRALLAEEPIAVQSMFYFKPPGSRGQALHQDNFYLRVRPGTCLAAWLAIDDADADNGAIECVSNTQNHPIQCPEQSDPSQSFTTEHVRPPAGHAVQLVPLRAGDVLFFNGNVIHGSGPNRSSRFRRAFICHYVPASTTELSHWYSTPYRFDRQLVRIGAAMGGGPCGGTEDALQGPH
jgi:ectoine hydroxylase-related dioxygenase (phytanoyl-CoA dioxygenase family)